MTPEQSTIAQFDELIELIEAGDKETAIDWLRTAQEALRKGEWPSEIWENDDAD